MKQAILPIVVLCAVQAHAAPAAVPVVAEFQTRVCDVPCKTPKLRNWYLLRSTDVIELRDKQLPVSQIWRRHADTRAIDYTYVMHDEKRAVEYTPVDLSMIERTPNWERLNSVLTARELTMLSPAPHRKQDGRAEVRSGRLGPAKVEVTWLRDEQLPNKLSYRYPAQTITIRLIGRFEGAAPVQPTSQAVLASYTLVDYADVGDTEHDPQERAWINKALMAPGHEDHAHGH